MFIQTAQNFALLLLSLHSFKTVEYFEENSDFQKYVLKSIFGI